MTCTWAAPKETERSFGKFRRKAPRCGTWVSAHVQLTRSRARTHYGDGAEISHALSGGGACARRSSVSAGREGSAEPSESGAAPRRGRRAHQASARGVELSCGESRGAETQHITWRAAGGKPAGECRSTNLAAMRTQVRQVRPRCARWASAARAQVAVKVVHRGPGRLPRELVVIAHLDVCSGRQGSGQAGGDRQRAAGQEGTRLMTPPQEDFGRRRAARPSRGLVWTRYGGTQ